MYRSIRVASGLIVITCLIGSASLCADDPAVKKPTAVAEILIEKKNQDPTQIELKDAFFGTQMSILRSHAIAERASRSSELQSLLRGQDILQLITSGLTVERNPEPGNRTLKLSINNVSGNNGVAILQQVIHAFTEFQDQNWKFYQDTTFANINRSRVDLQSLLQKADESYEKFITVNNWYANAERLAAYQKESSAIAELIARHSIELREIRATIDTITEASKNNDLIIAATAKAIAWAKNAGLERNHATIEAYLSSLRLDESILAKKLERQQQASDNLQKKATRDFYVNVKEEQLRDKRDRIKKNLQKTDDMVIAADLQRDYGGVRIRAITPPHAVD